MTGMALLSVIRTVPLAILLTLSVTSPVWGNEPAEVEALIEQANTYRRQGMDHKALPLMQRAYNIASTARTAAQLGLVEIALGYWLQAERHLVEALSSTRDPWIHKNRGELERALAGVRTSIGELEITGSPVGAEVRVNGQRVGQLPLAGPVRVGDGPVRVEVRASGFEPALRTMTMVRGAKTRLDLQLAAVPASQSVAAPQVDVTREPRSVRSGVGIASHARPAAIATATLAAVAIGVGAFQTFTWAKKRDEFNSHTRAIQDPAGMTQIIRDCGARNENRGGDECTRLYDDMRRARTLSIVGYASGAVLGAATVGLMLVAGRHGKQPKSSAVACALSSTPFGGACRVSF